MQALTNAIFTYVACLGPRAAAPHVVLLWLASHVSPHSASCIVPLRHSFVVPTFVTEGMCAVCRIDTAFATQNVALHVLVATPRVWAHQQLHCFQLHAQRCQKRLETIHPTLPQDHYKLLVQIVTCTCTCMALHCTGTAQLGEHLPVIWHLRCYLTALISLHNSEKQAPLLDVTHA